MPVVRARVLQGHLQLDEPVALREGAVLRLVPDEPTDEIDDRDRAALHAALLRSEGDRLSGAGVSGDELLALLDAAGG